jgi:hypothetical protein
LYGRLAESVVAVVTLNFDPIMEVNDLKLFCLGAENV